MHVKEGSAIKGFLEESTHFQTGDVLLLYGIVFSTLAIICMAQYLTARQRDKIRMAAKRQRHEKD